MADAKKWEWNKDILEQEEETKRFTLTKEQKNQEIDKAIDARLRYLRGNQTSEENKQELAFWQKRRLKLKYSQLRTDLDKSFFDSFLDWTQGRSLWNVESVPLDTEELLLYLNSGHLSDNAVNVDFRTCTPWGKKSILHLKDLTNFMEIPFDKREHIVTVLTKLRMNGPKNAEEAWVYYKYLVRGMGLSGAVVNDFRYFEPFDYPPHPQYLEDEDGLVQPQLNFVKDAATNAVPHANMYTNPGELMGAIIRQFEQEHTVNDAFYTLSPGQKLVLMIAYGVPLPPDDPVYTPATDPTTDQFKGLQAAIQQRPGADTGVLDPFYELYNPVAGIAGAKPVINLSRLRQRIGAEFDFNNPEDQIEVFTQLKRSFGNEDNPFDVREIGRLLFGNHIDRRDHLKRAALHRITRVISDARDVFTVVRDDNTMRIYRFLGVNDERGTPLMSVFDFDPEATDDPANAYVDFERVYRLQQQIDANIQRRYRQSKLAYYLSNSVDLPRRFVPIRRPRRGRGAGPFGPGGPGAGFPPPRPPFPGPPPRGRGGRGDGRGLPPGGGGDGRGGHPGGGGDGRGGRGGGDGRGGRGGGDGRGGGRIAAPAVAPAAAPAVAPVVAPAAAPVVAPAVAPVVAPVVAPAAAPAVAPAVAPVVAPAAAPAVAPVVAPAAAPAVAPAAAPAVAPAVAPVVAPAAAPAVAPAVAPVVAPVVAPAAEQPAEQPAEEEEEEEGEEEDEDFDPGSDDEPPPPPAGGGVGGYFRGIYNKFLGAFGRVQREPDAAPAEQPAAAQPAAAQPAAAQPAAEPGDDEFHDFEPPDDEPPPRPGGGSGMGPSLDDIEARLSSLSREFGTSEDELVVENVRKVAEQVISGNLDTDIFTDDEIGSAFESFFEQAEKEKKDRLAAAARLREAEEKVKQAQENRLNERVENLDASARRQIPRRSTRRGAARGGVATKPPREKTANRLSDEDIPSLSEDDPIHAVSKVTVTQSELDWARQNYDTEAAKEIYQRASNGRIVPDEPETIDNLVLPELGVVINDPGGADAQALLIALSSTGQRTKVIPRKEAVDIGDADIQPEDIEEVIIEDVDYATGKVVPGSSRNTGSGPAPTEELKAPKSSLLDALFTPPDAEKKKEAPEVISLDDEINDFLAEEAERAKTGKDVASTEDIKEIVFGDDDVLEEILMPPKTEKDAKPAEIVIDDDEEAIVVSSGEESEEEVEESEEESEDGDGVGDGPPIDPQAIDELKREVQRLKQVNAAGERVSNDIIYNVEKLNDAVDTISKVQAKTINDQKNIQKIIQDLSEEQTKIEQRREELNKIEIEHIKVHGQISTDKKRIEEEKIVLDAETTRLNQIRAEITKNEKILETKKQQKINQINQQKQSLREAKQQFKDDMKKANDDLKAKKDALKLKKTKVDETDKKTEKKLEKLQKEQELLDSKKHAIHIEKENIKAGIEKYQEEIIELKQKITELENKPVQTAKKKITKKDQEEIALLEKSIAPLKERSEYYRRAIANIREHEIGKASAKIHELEEDEDLPPEEIKAEIARLKAVIVDNTQVIKGHDEEIERVEESIKEYETKIASLRTTAVGKKHTQKLQELRDKEVRIENTITQMRLEYEAKKDELTNAFTRVQNELRLAKSEYANLQIREAKLINDQRIAQQTYDNAIATLETQHANAVSIIKAQLDAATIKLNAQKESMLEDARKQAADELSSQATSVAKEKSDLVLATDALAKEKKAIEDARIKLNDAITAHQSNVAKQREAAKILTTAIAQHNANVTVHEEQKKQLELEKERVASLLLTATDMEKRLLAYLESQQQTKRAAREIRKEAKGNRMVIRQKLKKYINPVTTTINKGVHVISDMLEFRPKIPKVAENPPGDSSESEDIIEIDELIKIDKNLETKRKNVIKTYSVPGSTILQEPNAMDEFQKLIAVNPFPPSSQTRAMYELYVKQNVHMIDILRKMATTTDEGRLDAYERSLNEFMKDCVIANREFEAYLSVVSESFKQNRDKYQKNEIKQADDIIKQYHALQRMLVDYRNALFNVRMHNAKNTKDVMDFSLLSDHIKEFFEKKFPEAYNIHTPLPDVRTSKRVIMVDPSNEAKEYMRKLQELNKTKEKEESTDRFTKSQYFNALDSMVKSDAGWNQIKEISANASSLDVAIVSVFGVTAASMVDGLLQAYRVSPEIRRRATELSISMFLMAKARSAAREDYMKQFKELLKNEPGGLVHRVNDLVNRIEKIRTPQVMMDTRKSMSAGDGRNAIRENPVELLDMEATGDREKPMVVNDAVRPAVFKNIEKEIKKYKNSENSSILPQPAEEPVPIQSVPGAQAIPDRTQQQGIYQNYDVVEEHIVTTYDKNPEMPVLVPKIASNEPVVDNAAELDDAIKNLHGLTKEQPGIFSQEAKKIIDNAFEFSQDVKKNPIQSTQSFFKFVEMMKKPSLLEDALGDYEAFTKMKEKDKKKIEEMIKALDEEKNMMFRPGMKNLVKRCTGHVPAQIIVPFMNGVNIANQMYSVMDDVGQQPSDFLINLRNAIRPVVEKLDYFSSLSDVEGIQKIIDFMTTVNNETSKLPVSDMISEWTMASLSQAINAMINMAYTNDAIDLNDLQRQMDDAGRLIIQCSPKNRQILQYQKNIAQLTLNSIFIIDPSENTNEISQAVLLFLDNINVYRTTGTIPELDRKFRSPRILTALLNVPPRERGDHTQKAIATILANNYMLFRTYAPVTTIPSMEYLTDTAQIINENFVNLNFCSIALEEDKKNSIQFSDFMGIGHGQEGINKFLNPSITNVIRDIAPVSSLNDSFFNGYKEIYDEVVIYNMKLQLHKKHTPNLSDEKKKESMLEFFLPYYADEKLGQMAEKIHQFLQVATMYNNPQENETKNQIYSYVEAANAIISEEERKQFLDATYHSTEVGKSMVVSLMKHSFDLFQIAYENDDEYIQALNRLNIVWSACIRMAKILNYGFSQDMLDKLYRCITYVKKIPDEEGQPSLIFKWNPYEPEWFTRLRTQNHTFLTVLNDVMTGISLVHIGDRDMPTRPDAHENATRDNNLVLAVDVKPDHRVGLMGHENLKKKKYRTKEQHKEFKGDQGLIREIYMQYNINPTKQKLTELDVLINQSSLKEQKLDEGRADPADQEKPKSRKRKTIPKDVGDKFVEIQEQTEQPVAKKRKENEARLNMANEVLAELQDAINTRPLTEQEMIKEIAEIFGKDLDKASFDKKKITFNSTGNAMPESKSEPNKKYTFDPIYDALTASESELEDDIEFSDKITRDPIDDAMTESESEPEQKGNVYQDYVKAGNKLKRHYDIKKSEIRGRDSRTRKEAADMEFNAKLAKMQFEKGLITKKEYDTALKKLSGMLVVDFRNKNKKKKR